MTVARRNIVVIAQAEPVDDVPNAAGKKQERRGGLFGSTKGMEHGFGLARVESIVKKYGGLFSADSEDGGFTAEILIPLE